MLDEFHERHLDGDLSLALLRRLQATSRPDLRLLVMSATIDTAPVARYLGDCVVLRSEGRLFPLSIDYSPSSADPLPAQVAAALERLLRDGLDGDVLVFLPGAAEIRQAMRACLPLAAKHGFDVLPLYGDLTPAEQDRAVAASERRKVIVSTNVAESSITIEGVTAVIDSGLARVAGFSAWSGLPTLSVAAGQQGLRESTCGTRGPHPPRTGDPPLSGGGLSKAGGARPAGNRAAGTLRDVPSGAGHGVRRGGVGLVRSPAAGCTGGRTRSLLGRLGAVDAAGGLTSVGRRMARYPLHPRLARLIVEAGERGAGDDGCAVAALLSAGQRTTGDPRLAGPSDLIALLESEWEPNARRIYQQLRRVERLPGGVRAADEPLLKSVLAAFPDRVARRRQADELLLASGGSAVLAASSMVRAEDWLVAVDIEERRERGLPLVRLASAIRPEWLLDMFPNRVREEWAVDWNRKAERVEATSALALRGPHH